MPKRIYLDHSATTPVDKKVLAAMLPYFNIDYGNPSSIHSFGQKAMKGIEQARQKIAIFLNCTPEEIIFTSGATEADNLAIFGVIKALQRMTKQKLHIITSRVEHPAVLEPFHQLESEGIEVAFLPVQKNGIVRIEDFKKAIKDDTVFVSIMYVNSEVGCIQPIREMGKLVERINQQRIKKWQQSGLKTRQNKPLPIYFHTDAVQAANFLNCDVEYLKVNLLSLSGHKIYGPKGIGALFVKTGTPIMGLQVGGHHEKNIRSGTLNVSGIVGFGKAIELLNEESKERNKKIVYLRDYLVQGIIKNIPSVILNTDIQSAVSSHANFSFLGAEGESILIALDLAGIAVSTGSACASASLRASHVLLAMGIDEEVAHNSVRFTLGKKNNLTEIKQVIKILPAIIKRLRQIAPKF